MKFTKLQKRIINTDFNKLTFEEATSLLNELFHVSDVLFKKTLIILINAINKTTKNSEYINDNVYIIVRSKRIRKQILEIKNYRNNNH